MILRSLKLTNFRGVESVVARDLAGEGVVRIALPGKADPAVLSDAVRFAFTGVAPAGGVLSDGAGFAFVEVGFRAGGDDRASLFRGVDGRGKLQVSLREEGGRRVTGGEDAVTARLTEILGGDPAARLAGVWLSAADLDPAQLATLVPQPDDTAEITEPVKLVPLPDFTEETGVAVAGPLLELRQNALSAAQDLRRALRAERLGREAAARHTELLAIGARLRRERLTTAASADALAAERDRVRTRLRRLAEYHDQAATEQARDADELELYAPPRAQVSFTAPWTLATLASGLFLVLVLVSTGRDGAAASEGVQTALGVTFVVLVALSVGVTARRLSQEMRDEEPFSRDGGRSASRAPGAWRESLKRRFEDLGDPDDPALQEQLGARAAELDAELGPLHENLEQVDDALTAFDVEAGRAARALHLPMPDRATAADGLAEGETVDALRARARDVGDAVYQATVERDALLAGGAGPLPAAADAAARALGELAEVAEDRDGARHAGLDSWRALGSGEAPTAPLAEHDEAWEDAQVATLEETIERLAVTAAARAAGVPAPTTTLVASAAGPTTEADVLAASTAVSDATDGDFLSVYRRSDGGLRARASGSRGREDWDDLEPAVRTRIALALALSAGSAARAGVGDPPGVVVLPAAEEGVDDDALLAGARAGRRGVVQVIAPAAPSAANASAPPPAANAPGAEAPAVEAPSAEPPSAEPPIAEPREAADEPAAAEPPAAKATKKGRKKATRRKGKRKSSSRRKKKK